MRYSLVALAAVAALGFVAAGPARADWNIETIERNSPYAGSASVALDAAGRPTVAYGRFIRNNESDLMFAVRSGGTWNIESLDSDGNTGHCTSLAYDGAGRPGIAYYTSGLGTLKYISFSGAAWTTPQVVDQQARSPSLARDAAGRARISYYDFATGNLKYAAWTGSAWNIQTVDSSGHLGGARATTSLALDALGRPHIAYYDEAGQDLKYATWTGSTWDTRVVDTGGVYNVGQHASLALDQAGRPRIAYYDVTKWHLKYAAWTGSSWAIQRVTPGGVLGPGATYAALALDSRDFPHIGFLDWYDTSSLRFASWDGSAWTFETIDDDINGMTATSLTFDAYDNPYLAYHAYDSMSYSVLRLAWIPEPATLALVAAGGLALLWRRRQT